MKYWTIFRTLTIAATLFTMSACLALAQSDWRDEISKKEAIRIVREFSNPDDAAPIEIKGEHGWIKVIASDRTFEINTLDRRVFDMSMLHSNQSKWYQYDHNNPDIYLQMLPEQMLRETVISFMKKHFPNPDAFNELKVDLPIESLKKNKRFAPFIRLVFQKKYPNGTFGSAFCSVTVTTLDAEVIGYIHWDTQDIISPMPRLSPEQAMNCALNTVFTDGEPVKVDELKLMLPDRFDNQRLVYKLRARGTSPYYNGRGVYLGIWVDANTGEVLGNDMLTGLASTKDKFQLKRTKQRSVETISKRLKLKTDGREVESQVQPLLLSGSPYLPVKCLTDGKSDFRFNKGGLAIITKRCNVKLIAGSTRYKVEGKPFVSATPVQLVNDRLYIPLDLYRQVSGREAKYDLSTQTIDLISRTP